MHEEGLINRKVLQTALHYWNKEQVPFQDIFIGYLTRQ